MSHEGRGRVEPQAGQDDSADTEDDEPGEAGHEGREATRATSMGVAGKGVDSVMP